MAARHLVYQREMLRRLEVPVEVLSDEHFALIKTFELPTFQVEVISWLKKHQA